MVMYLSMAQQRLYHERPSGEVVSYSVSTAKAGPGECMDSYQTPRGKHIVRAKIGEGLPISTIFVGRRPTGEQFNSELFEQNSDRDWILSRILWLSGCDIGKNRLGKVDTMRRYIYIHGTPPEYPMGIPLSHGCVRMHPNDIESLFDHVSVGERLIIREF